MVAYGVALVGLIVSGCIYLHVSSILSIRYLISPFITIGITHHSPLGFRKIPFRPYPPQLKALASQHLRSLGHLARLHRRPRCHFLHLRRGHPDLQLSEFTDGVYLLRASRHDASRLALAVRPWSLP